MTADFQTRGRGQRGRQWQAAAAESALMSFVYRLPTEAEVSQLGLVVALAVADAVASVTYLDPRLKWPNDILLDGRKTAGILVEVVPPPPILGSWKRRGGGKARGRGKQRPYGYIYFLPCSPELGRGGNPRHRHQCESRAV